MNDRITQREFEDRFPMTKIFEVESVCYIYDGKSCLLAEITSAEISQIYNYYLGSRNLSMADYLKGLLEKGVFSPGSLQRVTPECAELEERINFQMEKVIPRTLMLEITENCNLNCSYCFFAKEDGFDKRKHSRRNMDEAIAYKAIDYYYNRYIHAIGQIPFEKRQTAVKQNPPMLQWWGGEPFATYDLIVKTKAYFESLDWAQYEISSKDINYGLTSNLTLFDKDILNFIVRNNIKLRVSLDGDKEAHNKNRIFPNGVGSFETVIKNLHNIIDKYPDYAKHSVGIQSVLAENINMQKAQKFIKEHFSLNTPSHKLVMCSVSPQRKRNIFLSESEITNVTIEEDILLFKKKLDQLISQTPKEIEKSLAYNRKLFIELKKILLVEELLTLDYPQGNDLTSIMFSCPLGADTIFVSVNGDFHCCAKTDYSFPFGNIETGMEKEKLKEIYAAYHHQVEKQCNSCWAFRFCNICPALTGNEKEFLLPRDKECEQIRKNVLLSLIQYTILTEKYECLYSQIKSLNEKEIN